MNLTNEAAYLYSYSKKLIKINQEIRNLSKKAEKKAHKHRSAKDEDKKNKHRKKHQKITKEIKSLMKEHNKVLIRLRHHQVAFHHALHKEHKI